MKKWCLMIVMFCFLLVLPGTAFAVDSTGWMGPDQKVWPASTLNQVFSA